jgi:hypothetical protein
VAVDTIDSNVEVTNKLVTIWSGEPLQGSECLFAGKSLHLFELTNGHYGGQRLSLALDDELIVPKRYSVKDVTELLPFYWPGSSPRWQISLTSRGRASYLY